MRRCLLRLGPAAVDPRGVELLSAHLSVVFLCGAFSPAASPLPTHQLREGADFLAPLPILPHSLRSRGDKHRVKVQAGQRCSFSVSGDFNLFFIPPISLAPSTHATQLLPLDQTGLNLKRTRRHFVISEISSSLFSSLWRLRGASSKGANGTRRNTVGVHLPLRSRAASKHLVHARRY